jgi:MFS family permease
MDHFKTATSTGIAQTWVVMGIGYFVFMLFGAITVRLPPPDWKPAGYIPSARPQKLITSAQVTADEAITTPQFYLVWFVLFLNVTAGIAVLKQASPMIQDMFSDVTAEEAGGFVGLLSIFNMAGRFLWSSLSDYIGRKATYAIFFLLGAALYALVPGTGHMGSKILFIACCAVILSMYGGGFATVPAYLKDLFGTMQVGAIHGRLLTAWSAAGIAGPVLITYIGQYLIDHGVSKSRSYDYTLYLMAVLLLVGAVCNFLITPVDPRHHFEKQMSAKEAAGA